MNYVVPVAILAVFIYALVKKTPLFDTFAEGAKEALKLMFALAPYLIAIFIALELLRESGISSMLARVLHPIFQLTGIPVEVSELLILRPLSGSGSLAVLEQLYAEYGTDSYVGRVASVIMASTDTIMYIAAVYLSTSRDKKSHLAIPIALVASLIGAVLAAFVCRII